jgi:hypothetical protein
VEVMAQLKDVDGVVWAQGISQTKVDKEYVFLPFVISAEREETAN